MPSSNKWDFVHRLLSCHPQDFRKLKPQALVLNSFPIHLLIHYNLYSCPDLDLSRPDLDPSHPDLNPCRPDLNPSILGLFRHTNRIFLAPAEYTSSASKVLRDRLTVDSLNGNSSINVAGDNFTTCSCSSSLFTPSQWQKL